MKASAAAIMLLLCVSAWAADEGVLNPVDFGADPTGVKDSAAAFAQLDKAAEGLRQVQVRIPPGRFRLATPVTLHATGNQTNYGLLVQGAGEDVTELVVDNSEGGLQFSGTNINRLSVVVRDLSLVALRPDGGTALAFSIPNPGDHHSRQFQVENVLIRGERFNNGCFRYGVVVRNAWYPRFVNVKVTSSYGPESPAAPRALETAFLLEDCYSPLLRDCYVWGGRYGLIHRAVRSEPEDGIVEGCYFVDNERSISVLLKPDASRWEEPAFHISTCHVNYRDFGITLQGVRQANISHCLFYCHDRQGAAFYGGGKPRDFDPVDVNLVYASDVVIDGNIFAEPANPRRVAVRISKDSGYVMVSGNQFNLQGVAVRNESALPSFCLGNFFGGRRDFSTTIRRYDDRTGTLKCSDAN
jgi:hypothetical protein